jgi:hypothetical protein
VPEVLQAWKERLAALRADEPAEIINTVRDVSMLSGQLLRGMAGGIPVPGARLAQAKKPSNATWSCGRNQTSAKCPSRTLATTTCRPS